MLYGFTVPLTPQGKSALASPPPWITRATASSSNIGPILRQLPDNLSVVDVWAGSAELTIPDVRGEDMHSLAPLRVGLGFRLGMSYSVTDLRILKNYVT